MGLKLFFFDQKKEKEILWLPQKKQGISAVHKKNPVFVKPAVMFPGVIKFKSH